MGESTIKLYWNKTAIKNKPLLSKTESTEATQVKAIFWPCLWAKKPQQNNNKNKENKKKGVGGGGLGAKILIEPYSGVCIHTEQLVHGDVVWLPDIWS